MPNMTIRLPEDKLQRLRQAAHAKKKSANAIVEEAIDAYLPEISPPTLADVLKDFIGAGGDGPASDSSAMSDVFGEAIEQKHREILAGGVTVQEPTVAATRKANRGLKPIRVIPKSA